MVQPALVYYKNEIDQLDPTKLTLPGWDASYSPDESVNSFKLISNRRRGIVEKLRIFYSRNYARGSRM